MPMRKSQVVLFAMLAIAAVVAIASESEHNYGWHRHPTGEGGFNQNPTIKADRAALEDDFLQLRGDHDAGATAAVVTDQTTLRSDAAQLQSDIATLKLNIKNNVAVQADKTTVADDRAKLWTDRIQVRSDIVAGNTSAVATDKITLAADRTQFQTDVSKLKQGIDAVIAVPVR